MGINLFVILANYLYIVVLMSLQKLASYFKGASFDGSFKNNFDVEYFAKKASESYLKSNISLNDSIRKIASDNGFNQEQVKRICETANHNVNQELFDKQADKNVYFKVADFNEILDQPVKTASLTVYSFSPKELQSKTAEKIASTVEKTASSKNETYIEISGLDPLNNVRALKEKVASLLQDTTDTVIMSEFRIKEAQTKLYKEALVVLETEPYYKIAQAIAMSTNNHSILEDLTEKLIENGKVTEEDMYTIVKTAGELDTGHILVQTTIKLASLENTLKTAMENQKLLTAQLVTIQKELR